MPLVIHMPSSVFRLYDVHTYSRPEQAAEQVHEVVSEPSLQCDSDWFDLVHPAWNLECPEQYVRQLEPWRKLLKEDVTDQPWSTGVGAGGQQKPYLVNAANALTYGYVEVPDATFTLEAVV